MKVIICFGDVRVVVPCGEGELLVKELVDKAVHRYLKTLNKPSGIHVNVSSLKTSDGEGILDPGDKLKDVADDKEQLVATFSVTSETLYNKRGGDGTSGSSAGTPSPELPRVDGGYGVNFPRMHDLRPTFIGSQDLRSRDDDFFAKKCCDEDFQQQPHSSVHTRSDKSSSPQIRASHVRQGSSSFPKSYVRHDDARNSPYSLPNDFTARCQAGNANERMLMNPKDATRAIEACPDVGNNLVASLENFLNGRDNNNNNNGRFHSNSPVSHQNFLPDDKMQTRCRRPRDGDFDLQDLSDDGPLTNGYRVQPRGVYNKVDCFENELSTSTPDKFLAREQFLVDLMKGPRGLGFSVTTRDNKTSEESSLVFVKKILPSGSAVEDGRLQPGDCILEVNGVAMTAKTQEEVVQFLRRIPINEVAELLITRKTKPFGFPPNAQVFPEATSPSVVSVERADALNRNRSEGSSLYDLGSRNGERSTSMQDDCSRLDSESVLSFESDSRRSRSRFAREGVGRQSMSEKRKGHLDPRSTETYFKTKDRRAEKKQNFYDSAESLLELNNFPGLKQTSSCDRILGNFRTRGTNESFRAAIDRCLDDSDLEARNTPERTNETKISNGQRNAEYPVCKEKERSARKGLVNVLRFGKTKKAASENEKKSNKPSKITGKSLRLQENDEVYRPTTAWK